MRKTMKNAMAGVLTAGMLAGGVLAVSAAAPQEGSMAVIYTKTQDSSFVLSIPSTVELSETEEKSQTVGITAINVKDSEKVQITVTKGIADGKVTLANKEDAAKTVSSTVSLISGGTGIADDAVVAEFEGTSTTATEGGTLYFAPVGEDAEVGTYEGTITFEASITAK